MLSSIIMLANLKPIYLHYLYLNMDLYKVYLDVVPAVYAAIILKPIYLHYLYLNMDLYKVYLDVVPAVYAASSV